MMCPRELLLRSEFYNDFLRLQNLSHALGATVARSEHGTWNISVFREHGGRFYQREDLDLLSALAPHLGRAVHIQIRTEELKHCSKWQEACLDRVAVGILSCTADARVVYANRAARALLDAKDGIALDGGRLRAVTPSLTLLVRGRVAAAAHSPTDAGSLRLDRGLEKRPLHVLVCPSPASTCPLCRRGGAVTLFVTDPDREVHLDARDLRDRYDLTPAEVRVAELLVRGEDLAGISRKLGVSIHTTRSQVKHALEKTATSRQSELVALLMRTAAIHEVAAPPAKGENA
jgi:DNA-binding CsgD family transcriptional regulator